MSLLVVENLVKTYPGGRKSPPVEAVRDVSFAVEPGEFFGILGPNGAGKSTTIGCISTLVRPTSGRILVDGVDLIRAPAEAKRRIAVVPQTRNLDSDLTVREILTFHGRYFGLPAAEREARADRLLEEMQVADKAKAKPVSRLHAVTRKVKAPVKLEAIPALTSWKLMSRSRNSLRSWATNLNFPASNRKARQPYSRRRLDTEAFGASGQSRFGISSEPMSRPSGGRSPRETTTTRSRVSSRSRKIAGTVLGKRPPNRNRMRSSYT